MVHYLNLEYILLRIYEVLASLFSPVPGAVNEAPATLAFWYGQLAILGFSLSAILVLILMYVRVRLIIVEHEGFHHKEEVLEREAHKVHEEHKGNGRWTRIQSLMNSTYESDWRRAIIEADSMLADTLANAGYAGTTLGEQLKGASPIQFTTLDLAWKAHKIRNDIAHGAEGFHLTDRDARTAIDMYRRVFEEFGVL